MKKLSLISIILVSSLLYTSAIFARDVASVAKSSGDGRLIRRYQKKVCKAQGGVSDMQLRDGTKVDCLTGRLAIVFVMADEWESSLAKSLDQAALSGRKPAITLITIDKPSCKYKMKLRNLINHYALAISLRSVGDGDCFDN